MEQKNVVILGAGFAGVSAARTLAKKIKYSRLKNSVKIFLIDKHEYQTFTPFLYKVATTSKRIAGANFPDLINYKIDEIIGSLPITFIQSEISEINLKNNLVNGSAGSVPFDYLVLALGSEANFFNIPELKENSLPFKSYRDALAIRDSIWNLALEGNEKIKIIIGGGGPSGVELAGELANFSSELNQEFRNVQLDITIIDASENILSGLHPHLIYLAKQRLKQLKIKILTESPIISVKNKEVFLASGQLPFDILIWTGGVKPNHLISNLPFKYHRSGRIEVNKTFQCRLESQIKTEAKLYAVGDVCCFYNRQDKPVPQIARIAIKEGEIAALNIFENLKLKKSTKVIRHFIYIPKNYPTILTIGEKFTLAQINTVVLKGCCARMLKSLVELHYLISIMPFFKAIEHWLSGFIIRNKK
jgi:NADH dehydrogenase